MADNLDAGLNPESPEWAYCQDYLISIRQLPKEAPSFEVCPLFSTLEENEERKIVGNDLVLSPQKRLERGHLCLALIKKHLEGLNKTPSFLPIRIYRTSQLNRLESLLKTTIERIEIAIAHHSNVKSDLTNFLITFLNETKKTKKEINKYSLIFSKQNHSEKSILQRKNPVFFLKWSALMLQFCRWAGTGPWTRRQLIISKKNGVTNLEKHLHNRWKKLLNIFAETFSEDDASFLKPHSLLLKHLSKEKEHLLHNIKKNNCEILS